MSRSRSFAAAIVLSLLVAPATAELCVIDAVPAATVLIPYFEVDLARVGTNKFEHTTVTLINNSPAPAIAHVIFWTDLSVPVINFDVFLTGFDKHEMDIDALFDPRLRRIPIAPNTEPAAGCTGFQGDRVVNISPADDFTYTDMVNAHTGRPVEFYNGQCLGRQVGNGSVARGYITIDNVNACSRLYPDDEGYFVNGGNGIANNLNALNATITRYNKKFLSEVPAVSIEAGTESGLSTSGNYTFYGRYNNFDASDNRECGTLAWQIPWQRRSGFKTEVIAWVDSGVNQGPFDCSQPPGWFPLSQSAIVAFDDQENPLDIPPDVFEAETQKIEVGRRPLDMGNFDNGWLFMRFANDVEFPAFVMVNQLFRKREGTAWGQFSGNVDLFGNGNGNGVETLFSLCGQPVSAAAMARAQQGR